MSFACRFVASALILLCVSSPLLAQVPEKVENWTAPPYWMLVKPHEKGAEPGPAPQAVTAVPTSALAFTGIPPCRLADTRGNGFAGQYGPPQIAAATGRTMTIAGQCGIPGNAEAVSFNFSAVNVPGPGFLVAYPAGGAFPPVATLVYNQNTPNLSNAAVVPLGTGGAITVVAGVVPVDLVIDVNGYYGPQGGPGGLLPSGSFGQTLRHNGTSWVASDALRNDGTDVSLSGVLRFPAFVRATAGLSLLFHNSGAAGSANTFFGVDAGNLSTIGDGGNSAYGSGALHLVSSGDDNTAVGRDALTSDQNGGANTAVGRGALLSNQDGGSNTTVGFGALLSNAHGSNNIAVGWLAGRLLTSGDNNMYLGNEGVASESNTIRIGTGSSPAHTRLFVAGVLGTNIGTGTAIYINGVGQVGTNMSSARYKEDVREMGNASDRLLKLRPVTFRYKGHPDDPTQFGLIAEEVDKVLPELVFHNAAGEPETVLYHEMPAMLLNEIQKQQRRIEQQDAEIARLRDQQGGEIARLRKQLESLEGRIGASESTSSGQ